MIAGLSSCKELENVDGTYDVVMVGSEDYSRYDITMNIEMGEENRISGKSACNNYSGTFENPKSNQVVMGMFMGTKMFCKDTNAIERDYMDRLSQVTTVKTTSDGLKMMNADDEVIITAIKTQGKK
jgi:heat shock protein HslJ